MTKILKLLEGKKGMIASIIGTVSAYCAVKGYIGQEEVLLIGSLSTIFFGTASYATRAMNASTINKIIN